MSLVVITRTRENMRWQTVMTENDLDHSVIHEAVEDGWEVQVEPYQPEDD